MSRPAITCGTHAGYQRHIRRREATCEPCRAARAAWQKEWRNGDEDRKKRSNEQERARSRALWRLADLHREEFAALYVQERTKDHVEKMKANA